MDGEGGFFSNGSFYLAVLPHTGIKSREEVFDVGTNKFISIATYFLLKLNLVNMKLLEISNNWVISAGTVNLFQHPQIKSKALTLLL